MAKSPPRPSDHSRSCPAYSPSAKYSSCTCGVFTPRKGTRPTIAEATAAAIALEVAETEAERKGRELREAMEAAMMSPGTTSQKSITAACPRCSECIGQKHHWLEATVYEPNDPAYECKHCDAACGMRSDGAPNGKLMPRRPDDDDIAAAEAELDQAGTLAPPTIGSGYPGGGVDRTPRNRADSSAALATILNNVEKNVSRVLARRMLIGPTESDGYASLEIRQRCGACRADIVSLLANDVQFTGSVESETLKLFGSVGLATRHAYLRHRCQPIAIDGLLDLSRAELEQLAQELERDGTAMVDRSIAIANLAKERQS